MAETEGDGIVWGALAPLDPGSVIDGNYHIVSEPGLFPPIKWE